MPFVPLSVPAEKKKPLERTRPSGAANALLAVPATPADGAYLADTALLVSAFSLVNIPAMLVWAGFGVGLRQALQAPGRVRAFNIVMGLLLAASVLAFLRN